MPGPNDPPPPPNGQSNSPGPAPAGNNARPAQGPPSQPPGQKTRTFSDFLKSRLPPAIGLVVLLAALIWLPNVISRQFEPDQVGSSAVVYSPPAASPLAQPRVTWQDARIQSISTDKLSLEAQVCSGGHPTGTKLTFAAQSAEMQSALKTGFAEGDRVALSFDIEKDNPDTCVLQSIQVVQYHVTAAARVTTLIIVALMLLVAYWLLLAGNFPSLILGADNRYSNSKFQMVVWFSILMITYVSVLWLRGTCGGPDFAGGVNIPQHLLILSGLSALTFATAKGITVSKVKAGNAKVTNTGAPSFPADLFNDDAGNVDLADFQTVVITILAVAAYLVQTYGFLDLVELHKTVTLLDVDTTILAVFGLGHGAYLAKKQIGDGGGPSNTHTNGVSENPVIPTNGGSAGE